MLVDRDTLDVRPVADSLLAMLAGGQIVSDVEVGSASWSNELALHVIELKATEPSRELHTLLPEFQRAFAGLAPFLDRLNLCLLPTAMHPWMNPLREMMLWPHECYEIYRAYHRIFDCKRHGWANVQSVHLNLPFCGDREFLKLHSAVRVLLPLLPALSASSPIVEGCDTGWADSRLSFYAEHCTATPSLVGKLIPEPVSDEESYRSQILAPIEKQLKPLDVDGVLRLDFLNARGAIARFDRGSIEIRVLDVQEFPGSDIAICAAVEAVLRALVAEELSTLDAQQAVATELLRSVLDQTARESENAVLSHPEYLKLLGVEATSLTAGEVWDYLLERYVFSNREIAEITQPLKIIQEHGTLASRIRAAVGPHGVEPQVDTKNLRSTYRDLANCLRNWEAFLP